MEHIMKKALLSPGYPWLLSRYTTPAWGIRRVVGGGWWLVVGG